MNERTNERDTTSQASSSAAAHQEHLGGARGDMKPAVAATQAQAHAQQAVMVKTRTAAALRHGEELDALDEAADTDPTPPPAPVPAEPVPADPVPATPTAPVAPAAVAAEAVAPAAAVAAPEAVGAAAAGAGASATTTAAAASTSGSAAATGGFFSSTLGLASMAGGGVVVLAAAGGGSKSSSPAPAPATDTTAPTAPVVALTTDTGSSLTDKITHAAAISLSGIESGATVEYKIGSTGAWTTTYTAPTTDGVYDVSVRQTDAAGNHSAATTLNFTLDTTAPTTAPTLTLLNGAATGAMTKSALLTALTPSADASAIEYRVDGGTWSSTYTAPISNAAHTVDARQVDVAGNASAISTVNFTLDTVAPAAPVVALANGATSLTNSAILTPVTPDPGATVEYSVDAGNWSTTYAAPVGNILHTVDVRQTDAAGNSSAPTTLAFTLDTIAPAIPVVSLANGAVSGASTNSASLAPFAPTETGAVVEYRINGGTWGAYTPPTTDGAYTVEAQQVDAAGNASAPSAPLSFTLDTLAPLPATLALATPAVGGVVANSTVNVTGIELNAAVQYRVYTTGTTPSAWNTLAPDINGAYTVPSQATSGLYTVDVQVIDAAGNISPLGSTSFDLQGSPGPVVALASDTGVSTADLITANPTLNIPASATAALSQTQYSADGQTGWTTVTPTWSQGLNTAYVRYNDPQGATPPSLVTAFQFTLDNIAQAPTLSLQTGTSALTNSSAVTLVGVETAATIEYSTDGVNWVAQQPAAIQGANTLYVRQTDVAGNVSAASTALTFNFDNVAPIAPGVVLANGATSLTNSATLAALTGVEAGASVEYNVDNTGWLPSYTAPVGDILHTVQVRQTDAAGNVSAVTPLSFTLDTVAPASPVVALLNNATSLTNDAALAAITPEVGGKVEYSLNGSGWSTTYTPPTAPTNGTAYTVAVRQTDAAGNSSAPTTLAFTLDNVAPVTPGLALTADTGVSATDLITNNPAYTATATEANALVQFSTDNINWSATQPVLAEGANTLYVRQTDAAGNLSVASAPVTITLDTIAPAAPSMVLSGTQTAVNATTPVTNSAIDLVGVEPGAAVQYRAYTGATPSAWTSLVAVGGTYTVPSQPTSGLYTVDVQVTDAAGNTSILSSAAFNLQGTAGPVAQLVSDTGIAGDLITSNNALNIPASTTPGLTQIQYSPDGLSTSWVTWPPTTLPWAEGLNTGHFRYVDPTNATPPSLVTTFQFTLDTVAPDVTTSSLTYTASTLAATQGTLVATVALGANAAVGDTLTLTIANASAQPVAKALSAADIAAKSVSITIDQATLVSGTSTSASAQITDVAGNSLPAVVSTALVFDNVVAAPTGLALAVDSGLAGDNITNNANINAAALVGVEPGALVEYSLDGGLSWGAYTAPTVNGQHSVLVRQTDVAGNLSVASAPLSFTLDTATPTVASVALTYAASTLAATQGTVTATVALGANTVAGDTLALTLAGGAVTTQPAAVILSATDIANGSVTLTINQATLTSGSSYTASAQITDVAGNASATVASTALAFDNIVAAPTGLALAVDSGLAGDNITNNATLAALVGVEAGALVEYSLDNGAWGAYTPATLTNGLHTVSARQTDAAGNLSVASAPLSFTLDTVIPTASAVALAYTASPLAATAGTLAANVTLAAGTAAVGDTLNISIPNGATPVTASAILSAADIALGSVSVPVPTTALISGTTYTAAASLTDVAGNTSMPVVSTLAFDNIVAAPTGLALAVDSGLMGDNITNNATLAALVGVEAGALVEYSLDNGAWGAYVPPTLNGLHTVSARQTDAAGNLSVASAPLSFTLDTVAPVALAVSLLNDSADPSPFAALGLGTDRITKDPTANFTPETVGNLVEYSTNGLTGWTPITTLAPGALADGVYSLSVRETDVAGNTTTSAPGAYSFTLDATATTPTVVWDPLTSKVAANGSVYTKNGMYTANATDLHPSTDMYSLDGVTWFNLLDMTTIAIPGRLVNTITGAPFTLQVQSTDAAGNVSAIAAVPFILDNITTAPVVGLATDTGWLNDTLGINVNARLTSQPNFAAVATEANSTLSYSTDSGISFNPVVLNPTTQTFTPQITVDVNGAAIPNINQVAAPTEISLIVRQTDFVGNFMDTNGSFLLDNFAAAPVVTGFGGAGSGVAVNDATLTLGGESLTARFEVSADNGLTWVNSGIWSPTSMATGANNLLVHQIDDAGNISAATPFTLNLQGRAGPTGGVFNPDGASLFTALPTLTLTDTGISATDHITNNATIGLAAAQPNLINDTVSYSLDGGTTWVIHSTTDPAPLTPVTPFAPPPSMVTPTTYTLLVKESYLAGTTTHETPVIPMSVTVDTIAPTDGAGMFAQLPTAEFFTSTSTGMSTAVMRLVINEAVSVNANSAIFLGSGGAGYKPTVLSSGLSMDSTISLGVQGDGSTIVELHFAETTINTFINTVNPSAMLGVTDLAGNTATLSFQVGTAGAIPAGTVPTWFDFGQQNFIP